MAALLKWLVVFCRGVRAPFLQKTLREMLAFCHFITRKPWLEGVCKEQVDFSSSWVKDDMLKFVLRSVEANLRVEP